LILKRNSDNLLQRFDLGQSRTGRRGKMRHFLNKGVMSFAAVICALFALGTAPAAASFEQTLYAFCSQPNCSDGADPYGSVIIDSAGNLYGTTSEGGANGDGEVYKLSPNNTLTVLYSFKGGVDGATPYGGLVQDSAGNLYGTTANGGGGTACGSAGCGTVFKVTPKGSESILHAFCAKGVNCTDGMNPIGGLIIDSAGNLYGTTEYGGVKSCGCGTVFKLSAKGKETISWSFSGSPDGALPLAGLWMDKKGNLYGTTSSGGDTSCGCNGVVFEIRTTGLEVVLYNFCEDPGCADGRYPYAGVTADKKGNLYGTTTEGGTHNVGTAYKVAADGTETVLHSFSGNSGDEGFIGSAGVVLDSAGNLFGASTGASQGAYGTLYQIAPNGTQSRLYLFVGGLDGDTPEATPILNKGVLYGTTLWGGSSGCGGRGCGTVYRYVQ
jgi:uncharacterized repeat protein (TIGR03803 family)